MSCKEVEKLEDVINAQNRLINDISDHTFPSLCLELKDVEIIRQWFTSLTDVHPAFIQNYDIELSKKIMGFVESGRRFRTISLSVKDGSIND